MSNPSPLRPATRRRNGDLKPKAARRIAKSIVREIHKRKLQSGDKLISEQKMVERYGVARGSLREALRFLELQGVLRLKSGPGGGPVVESPSAQHLAGTLALLLQFGGAPFRSIIETRLAIEPGIAALAATSADEHDLAALRRCLASMSEHLADGATFQEENRTFHDLVAFASGNLVFRVLLPALHWISDGSGISYTEAERRRILRAVRPIVAAIEARDADAASESMQRFFEASLAYLDRTYPEILAKPISWADMEL
jgi:DNA-binding FadR family transcriptional regulator